MHAAADLLRSLIVSAGFAAVGETVLRRRSEGINGWNVSFVTGMGVCGALLFPMSLIAPRRALQILLGGIVVAAAIGLLRRLTDRGLRPAPRLGLDRDARAVLALAVLGALAFAALDLRYNFLWDGFAIWASKGQRLYFEGGLTPIWYPGESYDMRYVSYPPAVPMYEACVAVLRGRFDFQGMKPLFLVLYASMAISTFSAARVARRDRLAAWAVVLVIFVPALSTRWAAGAYADMPQAAVVAAVVAAAMRPDADALPWLIGTLTTVKPEGLILCALSLGGIAFVLASRRRLRGGLSLARGTVIVGAFVLLRLLYIRWIHAGDDVYVLESWRLSITRIPTVVRLGLQELMNPRAWGLLWPAFFAAAVLLMTRGDAAEKALASTIGCGLVVMAVPFLFTTWPLELHMEQAYFRLLAQLAPAAVVAIVLAYARASSLATGSALSAGRA